MNKPVSSSLIALGDDMPAFSSDSKSPPTIESWQEMEMRLQYMNSQVEEAQAALARKHLAQQELQDRAEKAEQEAAEKAEHRHGLAQPRLAPRKIADTLPLRTGCTSTGTGFLWVIYKGHVYVTTIAVLYA